MLRRIMGAVVAFVLVATLLLPHASVGAQDDELDPGQQPVTTEETIPGAEPPAEVDEPPIEEPVIDEPVVEEPAVEQPAEQAPPVDEPTVEDPAANEPTGEEPVAEEPSSDEPIEATQTPEVPGEGPDVDGSQAHGPIVDESPAEAPAVHEAAGEEPVTLDELDAHTVIADATLTCQGVLTFTVTETPGETLLIEFYGAGVEDTVLIDQMTYDVTEPGTLQVSIDEPEFDRISADIRLVDGPHSLAFAQAHGCLDQEEPELPQVQNLLVTCDGLATFDLVATGEVTLDIQINVPATAPGFHADTQLTAETGPQQVQFDVPDGVFRTYAVSVDFNFESLGYATVTGCQTRLPNTLPGSDVTVEVGGGTLTFDEVLEVGDTVVTELDPSEAPALPAEFDGYQVILLDITTTAQFTGSVQICLPVAADAENVRLLHYENGAWIDITTSSGNGQVCGATSSFSPFGIVWTPRGGPVDPVDPKPNPGGPGHHGPKLDGFHAPASDGTSGSTLTSLPNTGSGAHTEGSGVQSMQFLLAVLALLVAGVLRLSSIRTRGARSR